MVDVMQTDAGRAMIKHGIEAGLPMIYGDFLAGLDLTDEESKYEEQLTEHQQMNGVRNALADEPLTPETEGQLVETLYQARLNSDEGNGSEEENWQQLGKDGNFEIIENRWKATDAEISKTIPGVLTPTQSKGFLEHGKTTRTMQALNYKMGMQMLGMKKE
ncbi:MAG: hypothetical protein ACJAQT_004859 [Akkermansiaceae bacterium]|jgi:hypothetical protein